MFKPGRRGVGNGAKGPPTTVMETLHPPPLPASHLRLTLPSPPLCSATIQPGLGNFPPTWPAVSAASLRVWGQGKGVTGAGTLIFQPNKPETGQTGAGKLNTLSSGVLFPSSTCPHAGVSTEPWSSRCPSGARTGGGVGRSPAPGSY